MAHLVESMFYVNEVPWHGLGTKLDSPPNCKKAIAAAGLDWNVNLQPIKVGEHQYNDFLAIQREGTNKIYGVVKPGWKPLQNIEAFHFFDTFVRNGLAEYHTAGSLKDGEKVWILAKLKSEAYEIAKDDFVEKYLLLSNSHNGKNGVRVSFTPIRVVCNNTLTMAEHHTKTQSVSIVHSNKVVDNLHELNKIIDIANRKFQITFEQYKKLANSGIKNLEKYIVETLYPNHDYSKDEEVSRTVQQIVDLYNLHPTNTLPSIRGTNWAAYNAVTFWVDHNRGRETTRMDQAWFGNGKIIKDRAFQNALALTA